MRQSVPDQESRPPPRTKHTLFCPDCGYEAPTDGDWRTADEDDDRLLVCPRCEEVIDRRPRKRRALAA